MEKYLYTNTNNRLHMHFKHNGLCDKTVTIQNKKLSLTKRSPLINNCIEMCIAIIKIVINNNYHYIGNWSLIPEVPLQIGVKS